MDIPGMVITIATDMIPLSTISSGKRQVIHLVICPSLLITRFFYELESCLLFEIQLDAKKQNHFRFFSEVIKFRHSHHVLKHENFLSKVIKPPPVYIIFLGFECYSKCAMFVYRERLHGMKIIGTTLRASSLLSRKIFQTTDIFIWDMI